MSVPHDEFSVFGEDRPYSCEYKIFWGEKCKLEAEKIYSTAGSYISFATCYLAKIAMLLGKTPSAYPWSVGKFNLRLDSEASGWDNVSLMGRYTSFSLADDTKVWIVIVKTLLYISKSFPELIIRFTGAIFNPS